METLSISLRVKGSGAQHDLPLDGGAHELLWAPNSKAFFVDGGTSAYAGFFISAYQLNSKGSPQKLGITNAAQKDMVATFPPCKALNHDEDGCKRIAAEPEYNMSGIAWTNDSSAVDIFAEVPCSSSYGGIMCQTLGYEIGVPTGNILRRVSASQVSQLWQRSMAWKMHIPDPPEYVPAH